MINGFNLRCFSQLGPQRTLYVPGSLLKTGENEIFIFESDLPHNDVDINLRIVASVGQQLWSY